MFAALILISLFLSVVTAALGNSTFLVFLSPSIILVLRSACLYWKDSDQLVLIVQNFRIWTAALIRVIGYLSHRREPKTRGTPPLDAPQILELVTVPMVAPAADERRFSITSK